MSIPISVAIVEDEEILRTGLAQRIESDERFTYSDVVGSAEEMLKSTNLSSINVFLIDIGLPGMSGIELIEHLRASDVLGQVLMSTNFDDDEHVRAAVLAGAKGYLLMTTPQARLNNAIEEIHVGGAPHTSNVAHIQLDYLSNLPKPSALDILTQRERDVLALLAERKQYKEIVDILFMSVDTICTHVRGIYSKLNVHKRSEAERIYNEKDR
jgi:DNA-binding NarL/FixJ family response regulator